MLSLEALVQTFEVGNVIFPTLILAHHSQDFLQIFFSWDYKLEKERARPGNKTQGSAECNTL